MATTGFRFKYCVLALGWALTWSPLCLGDGKIYPSVAYKTVPAIPRQRAIIIHREGNENPTVDECDLQQAESIVAAYFMQHPMNNIYEDRPVHQENSPGNYTIVQRNEDFFIQWYDSRGFPRDIGRPLFLN